MKRKTKGWSEERRQKQAENCRKTNPSQYATGPKTPAGKAAISQNARKHGLRSAEIRVLMKALTLQKSQIKALVDACPSP